MGSGIEGLANADQHTLKGPGDIGPGGPEEADPGPAIAGRQSCTADLGPSRDRYPKARYPKTLRKVSFFVCPRSSRPVEAVILRWTSGTHLENGAKRCTTLGSGEKLSQSKA